jgi:predicted nucleic acid-binding protein
MILVDTSIWIELLNGRISVMPPEIEPLQFVTCGPVVQEVRQGLRESAAARQFSEAFAAVPCLADPLPRRLFTSAAEILRSGRRRGYTIRSSVDCLIAAIAIEHGVPVWHRDRDYEAIAGFTELQTIEQKRQ